MYMYGATSILPYSWKIWRGIKFGSLAVYSSYRQVKIHQNFLLAYDYTYGDPVPIDYRATYVYVSSSIIYAVPNRQI